MSEGIQGANSIKDEIFSKNIVIPYMQRPYEWSDELIDGFFEDLGTYVEDLFKYDLNGEKVNAPYFFIGTIISHDPGDGTLNIVDGQQRTLPLHIFQK